MEQTTHTQITAATDAGISALFDFGFSRFITLSVIKTLYIVGLGLIGLMWIVVTIGGFAAGFLAGVGVLVVGAVAAVIYMVLFRVWLELIVVIFRIGENTSRLVELRGGTPTPTGL